MEKDLVIKLIDHYQRVINEYSKTGYYSTIMEAGCYWGICHCAEIVFNRNIYEDPWIQSKIKESGRGKFIAETPEGSHSKAYNLTLLQFRLDILKTHPSLNIIDDVKN